MNTSTNAPANRHPSVLLIVSVELSPSLRRQLATWCMTKQYTADVEEHARLETIIQQLLDPAATVDGKLIQNDLRELLGNELEFDSRYSARRWQSEE